MLWKVTVKRGETVFAERMVKNAEDYEAMIMMPLKMVGLKLPADKRAEMYNMVSHVFNHFETLTVDVKFQGEQEKMFPLIINIQNVVEDKQENLPGVG